MLLIITSLTLGDLIKRFRQQQEQLQKPSLIINFDEIENQLPSSTTLLMTIIRLCLRSLAEHETSESLQNS